MRKMYPKFIPNYAKYLVTGDGFDYFTDDLDDARRYAAKYHGVVYIRLENKDV